MISRSGALVKALKTGRRIIHEGHEQIRDDPYTELSISIILQAVTDYRTLLKSRRKRHKRKDTEENIKDLEEFFRSDWFKTLTDLDGEMLIKRLNEETKYGF